jgi:hypothetical protein
MVNNFNLNWWDSNLNTNLKENDDYQLQKINEEFKQINNEIIDIIRNDIIEDINNNNKFKPRKVSTAVNKTNSKNNKILNKGADPKLNNNNKNDLKSNNNISELANSLRYRPISGNSLPVTKNLGGITIGETSLNKSRGEKERYDVKKSLQEITKKQIEEDKNMKSAIEKRNKDFIKDCVVKIAEANKMCEELGVRKSFSTILDNVNCIINILIRMV